jgi:hypothetical protein
MGGRKMEENNNVETNQTIQDIGIKENNKICATGFGFGFASIFLYFIGIIPLAGIIISIIGLATFDKEKQKNLWMGIVGLILNSLYMLVNAYTNGHI